MAWSASAIFRAFVTDSLANLAAFDLSGTPDTFKVTLHNTTPTPDKDVASASSAYNTGVWTTTNIVFEAGEWEQTGQTLGSPALTNPTSGVVMWDGTDTASTGSTADLAAVFGCLVYDDTLTTPVADQGVSFHYFGGTQSVTNGSFTVVWNVNGLFRITV
jgi:hypothetical protein